MNSYYKKLKLIPDYKAFDYFYFSSDSQKRKVESFITHASPLKIIYAKVGMGKTHLLSAIFLKKYNDERSHFIAYDPAYRLFKDPDETTIFLSSFDVIYIDDFHNLWKNENIEFMNFLESFIQKGGRVFLAVNPEEKIDGLDAALDRLDAAKLELWQMPVLVKKKLLKFVGEMMDPQKPFPRKLRRHIISLPYRNAREYKNVVLGFMIDCEENKIAATIGMFNKSYCRVMD